ncbi:MAG: ParA family protein [Nitrospirae bacterium]|nr:ParA family protein [Nitrospirota bacterium]
MRIISFMSEKGGVGKSTLCVNVGAALAQMFNRRVLFLDLDGMACLSQTLAPHVDVFEDTIGIALIGVRSLPELIQSTPIENVWIVPGSLMVKNVESWDLSDTPTARDRVDEQYHLLDTVLMAEIARLDASTFDYVLIDCPGGHRFMEQSALMISDDVIIPTGLSMFDYYGIGPTVELIESIRQRRNSNRPRFLGFLPNGTTMRGVGDEARAYLESFSAPMFTAVRASLWLKSSPGWSDIEKRVLVRSRPNSQVALSIGEVAREIELGINESRAQATVGETEIERAAVV